MGLLDIFAQCNRELRFAAFRWVAESVAGTLAFRSFEEQSLFEAIRKTREASFAINISPYFEVEFMQAGEAVGDTNFDFSVIDGFVLGVGYREISGAGA